MVSLHAKILEKNGKKEFVVIPYEEFIEVKEELEDFECLKALRAAKAKEGNSKTIPLQDAKKILDIK